MADFVAVIRKAVEGLADNTPENRERVYEKARRAVRRQLENISPPPSEDIVRRQLDKLDAAIGEVELEHVEALPADDDDLSALSLDEREDAGAGSASREAETEPAAEAVAHAPDATPSEDRDPARQHAAPAEAEDEAPRSTIFAVDHPESALADDDRGPRPGADDVRRDARSGNDRATGATHDAIFGAGAQSGRVTQRKRARQRQLVIAVIAFFVVVAAAFSLWSNRKSLAPMIAGLTSSSPEKPASTDKQTAKVTPKPNDSGTAAQFPANKTPAASSDNKSAATGTDTSGGEKFTQRLMSDGSETDPGPAPEPNQPQAKEGSSVSTPTAEKTEANKADGNPAAGPENETPAKASAAGEQAAISQKTYLYEQRFQGEDAATTTGSVVWSLATDKSDDDGKATTVIHGEISIPDKGVTALMTIKPNTDPSLPASHLIELVFALPGDFSGGGINSVERIALKQTEQDRGNALIGVPAKITDNFFMIALNDYSQAIEKNLDLMKSRNWIDIPITYTNGRRALITLEKGSSGSDVFDKAFKDWARQKSDSTDASAGTGPSPDTPTGTTGSQGTSTPHPGAASGSAGGGASGAKKP